MLTESEKQWIEERKKVSKEAYSWVLSDIAPIKVPNSYLNKFGHSSSQLLEDIEDIILRVRFNFDGIRKNKNKVAEINYEYCYAYETAVATLKELEDYCEAAEFERRVAVKLANVFQHINDYWINLPCDACPQEGKCDMDCNDSILKWARLQVEEEMDNGMDI